MLKRDLDRHFLLLQPSNTPLCMALFSAHDFLPIGAISSLQGMKYDQSNSHFLSLPSGLTRSKGSSLPRPKSSLEMDSILLCDNTNNPEKLLARSSTFDLSVVLKTKD